MQTFDFRLRRQHLKNVKCTPPEPSQLFDASQPLEPPEHSGEQAMVANIPEELLKVIGQMVASGDNVTNE